MSSRVYFWVEDAQEKLLQAEHVCRKANEFINLINSKLISRDDNLPRLIYLLDSNRQQLRLLGIIKDSLVVNLQDLLSLKNNLSSKVYKDLAKLNKAIDTLRDTQIENEFHDREMSLIEFIDENSINSLIDKITLTLKTNEELVRKNRTDALLIRLNSDLDNYNNEFNNLNSQFTELRLVSNNINNISSTHHIHYSMNTETGSNETISKLLEINNELELDMVSILTSFNDHYKQCSTSVDFLNDPNSNETEKLQLMDVLENDFNELPNFLNLLNNDCDNIVKNGQEILKIVKKFDDLFEKLSQFTNGLKDFGKTTLFKQYFDDFATSTSTIRHNLNDTIELRSQINQVCNDYNHFIKSYHYLILEIIRRKEVNNKIENLINSFKLSLNKIKSLDLEDRSNFLQRHGDYIPQNIIDSLKFGSDNLLINQAPNLELSFHNEILPDISNESRDKSIKFLNHL